MSQKDDTEKDLESCFKWITAAAEHPKTANDPKMFFYKGILYSKAAYMPDYNVPTGNINDITIGMPASKVYQLMGSPSKINITKLEGLESKQLIYSTGFVYIDNGKVNAVQITENMVNSGNISLGNINGPMIDEAFEAFNNCLKFDLKSKYSNGGKDNYFGSVESNLLNIGIAYYNIAIAKYQSEDYEAARNAFKKNLSLIKYDVDGLLKRNNITPEVLERSIAFCAIGMGDMAAAKTSFQSLVDNGTSDVNTFISLSQLYLEDGDTTKALDIINKGKALNETDKNLINKELDIYLKQGRSAELITKLDKEIKDDPGNTIYYFARAISYEGLKDLDKAEADYNKILEIDPTYYDAAYNKGVMYLNKVASLVDEMNEKNVYKPSIIAKYESQINALYKKAIVEFENVFENNIDMAENDKFELANTMKKIYAQLQEMDKYNAMKAYIEANSK